MINRFLGNERCLIILRIGTNFFQRPLPFPVTRMVLLHNSEDFVIRHLAADQIICPIDISSITAGTYEVNSSDFHQRSLPEGRPIVQTSGRY